MIEQDIIASFETVIRQHREVSKKIVSDVQLLMRFCNDRKHTHDKLARKYGSRCSEAENVAQECLLGVAMKSGDRLKLAQKATTLSKQARVSEHEYYAGVEQVNRAQTVFDGQMSQVLGTLQDMDEKRAKCLKDGLMKLAVYETSWLRNLQYDLEATVKASESADPYKDLQDFIQQNQSKVRRRDATTTFAPQPFFNFGKLKDKGPQHKLQAEVQASVKQLMNDEIRPLLKGLLASPPLGPSEAVKAQMEQVRQGLGEGRRRAALCQALRLEILGRDSFQGPELDGAKAITVALAAFDGIVALFKSALDSCDEQNDAWCGRDLMVMTQLLRTDGGGVEKPVQLLSRVYNHALWNKVTFWEDALLLGLCEAHAAESVWRRKLPAGSQWSQPSMTAFLQRFVGYMMAFGISFDQGRNSVWATLRKHAPLLGGSSKAYATLLLQKYEELTLPQTTPAGPGTPSPANASTGPAPRTLEQAAAADPASTPGFTPRDGGEANGPGSDDATGASQLDAPEDDFEAVAFGLGSDFAQQQANDDQGDEATRGEQGETQKVIESQPSTSDVFD